MGVKGHVPVAARRYKKDRCERCGISDTQAQIRDGVPLHLHHRDMDRKNNSPENLATLCSKCHTQEHWVKGKKAHRKRLKCYACGGKAVKKGLCETCMTRVRRHGSPFLRKRKIGKDWILVDVRTGARKYQAR